jgi:hypothetical protein
MNWTKLEISGQICREGERFLCFKSKREKYSFDIDLCFEEDGFTPKMRENKVHCEDDEVVVNERVMQMMLLL